MQSVPPEILLRIFWTHVLDCRDRYRKDPKITRPFSWFTLLHVCRIWREIVLRETQIWAWLAPTVDIGCIDFIIAHCGDLPLSANIPPSTGANPARLRTAMRILKELPRIDTAALHISSELYQELRSAEYSSLDVSALKTLRIIAPPNIQSIPLLSTSALPGLQSLFAGAISYTLLQSLARSSLTTLTLRECALNGPSLLQLLSLVDSLRSLTLIQDKRLVSVPPAIHVALPVLLYLEIGSHDLAWFCEHISCPWSTLRLTLSLSSLDAARSLQLRSDPSFRKPLYELIVAKHLIKAREDIVYHLALHVKAIPLHNGSARLIKMGWKTASVDCNGKMIKLHSEVQLSILLPSITECGVTVEYFLASIPLPNTVYLSTDIAFSSSTWQKMTRALSKLEELHLSGQATRSFFVACNHTSIPLFPALKKLQLTTGRFAQQRQEFLSGRFARQRQSYRVSYDMLYNLQRSLSTRKRQLNGLSLQCLELIFDERLRAAERTSLQAAELAEQLQVQENLYADEPSPLEGFNLTDSMISQMLSST